MDKPPCPPLEGYRHQPITSSSPGKGISGQAQHGRCSGASEYPDREWLIATGIDAPVLLSGDGRNVECPSCSKGTPQPPPTAPQQTKASGRDQMVTDTERITT